MPGIHAVFQEPLHSPAAILPHCPDLRHACRGPGGGDGHVRALSAQTLVVSQRRQRFPGHRQMAQVVEIIDVDGAEVPDHSPTLQAARIAMFRMSFAVAVVEQI